MNWEDLRTILHGRKLDYSQSPKCIRPKAVMPSRTDMQIAVVDLPENSQKKVFAKRHTMKENGMGRGEASEPRSALHLRLWKLDASQLLMPRSWVARGLAVHRLALLLRMRVVDTWLWALCAPLRVHIATLPRLSRGGRPDSGPSTLSHAPSMFHCLSTSQIPFVLEYSLHSGLVE